MVGTVVIKRVFNNNVAMVTSDDGSELIVIGRGLCFGRHAGDAIDEASIEKTYALRLIGQNVCPFWGHRRRSMPLFQPFKFRASF